MMENLILLLWLSFADYKQSEQMFQYQGNYEMNPALGLHPSGAQMALFGLAGIGAAWSADRLISPTSHFVLDSVITSERLNVEANERVRQGYPRNAPIYIAVTFHF